MKGTPMTTGELHNEIVSLLDFASFKPGDGWRLVAGDGYLSAEHDNGRGKASVARMDVDSWPGRNADANARLLAILWNNAAMLLEALRYADDRQQTPSAAPFAEETVCDGQSVRFEAPTLEGLNRLIRERTAAKGDDTAEILLTVAG